MKSTVNALRAYLELIRYPLFAIPIVATLPGIVLASHDFGWSWRAPVALLTAMLGYFAGMIKNDYFHREQDGVANPSRPIPSGRVSARLAMRIASLLYIVCLILGFAMYWIAGLMVMGLIAISHSYNAYLKQRGVWGSLSLPFGIGMLSVFGAVSVAGYVPTLIWFAFGATFLYDFGTHITSTFKDIERDISLGITTTPIQMGRRPALLVSSLATLAAFGVALAPAFLGESPYYAVWIAVAFVATIVTRMPLLREQSEKNGYFALEGAMITAIFLFPALMATVIPFPVAAAIIVSLLLVTMRLLHSYKQEV
ncbi:MAG: UbiA family prenyltransferase [Candidatus Poribacteria bacterium]|nr:UbiA family prenyltransferase [Candidatus Poribacteria bacterium]